MTKIQNNPGAQFQAQQPPAEKPDKANAKSGPSFTSVLSGVADVALAATAAVAPLVPGGAIVGMAAGGLYNMKQASGQGPNLGGANSDQIDKMWAMQRENQAHNMQYMQLQEQIQSDNRNFSTMSNLMKVRHDTAKSAINNMHA